MLSGDVKGKYSNKGMKNVQLSTLLYKYWFEKVVTVVAVSFLEGIQLVENVGCSPVHQGWNLVFVLSAALFPLLNKPGSACKGT